MLDPRISALEEDLDEVESSEEEDEEEEKVSVCFIQRWRRFVETWRPSLFMSLKDRMSEDAKWLQVILASLGQRSRLATRGGGATG